MIKRSLLWALLLALALTNAQAMSLFAPPERDFPHEAGLMRAENPAGEERWLRPEEAVPEGFEVKEAVYLITFVQEGPVMATLCTDTLCQNLRPDENGQVWLLKAPGVYEVHLLSHPDRVWLTGEMGGETVIQLTDDK